MKLLNQISNIEIIFDIVISRSSVAGLPTARVLHAALKPAGPAGQRLKPARVFEEVGRLSPGCEIVRVYANYANTDGCHMSVTGFSRYDPAEKRVKRFPRLPHMETAHREIRQVLLSWGLGGLAGEDPVIEKHVRHVRALEISSARAELARDRYLGRDPIADLIPTLAEVKNAIGRPRGRKERVAVSNQNQLRQALQGVQL